MRGVHEVVRGAQPRVKSSMVEPNLYGYYKIGENCFLVKSEVLEGGRALHMLKFIDHVHPEEESIIPDAIKHVPSLILDRRSKMSIGIDELSSSGVPINVFHSVLFRRRECVYFKGMKNVYRISHEYLLDESEPRQPCVEINISLDIFDKYLSIYLFTKILRIFIYLFIYFKTFK